MAGCSIGWLVGELLWLGARLIGWWVWVVSCFGMGWIGWGLSCLCLEARLLGG
ncbi:hypothetical protein [Paenibacillus sp. Soil750]|uniref:hypothetical protein n=1 Tax=Paenibacillus sp. Soil750 TaxID=1736398 RepID=UPI0012FBDC80|nr:hypothetical protein [Paenibacillus sp. Soil750]